MATENNIKTFNLVDNTIYTYILICRQITIVDYYLYANNMSIMF